ncbi:hypothetical protein FOQG_07475 [Fusarium oxysporum f. sp. raphani 54005]|uniref:DUF7707 domain-containing protein n=9 Tax=Fusarium oxysporum TaxID=5507 RepID=A0A2H3SU33_FUSOX|nr:hypothetical protein FOXB_10303 [Fusarium oxysporum f. sp. conglutinans Fo5176]ENH60695.1 hypothetical protein FOC1_g10015496 [Fusarium oxysporum f. sp. cubense race 1]EXA53510.1 hypothetical protein FOVG_01312 [Fusarium oxysporum f. sp. pisi HDV247]EXK90081.1 hypothetical protein FOQG_07475 [Fusarium oxysporum f. sp. raphani 54005]EXL83728.1 hypothetical protein FOPG_03785 [Fusarium oxysporum f. sp. conglutinans race 2 54008]EXM28421.1 hypothetical protein FOTG_05724 [Fusarium oxysporum f.
MRSSFALLAMAVSAVSAQSVKDYKSSLDMTIDPNTVDLATRSSWCGAQQNTCDALCKDDTNENKCTENDLKWECTCSSNSSTPGLQYYTQTMPTFICQELFSQCISQNTGSQSGQRECTSKIDDKCAKQNPPKDVVSDDNGDTTSTASDTATTSATRASSAATGTAESVTSTTSDGFAAPTMAPAGRGAAAAVALGMLAYLI